MMNQASIIVKNLCVHLHGNTLLDDITFSLAPGEHLLITGEAGSGKTTLAKAIAGKLFYTGSVEITSGKTSVQLVEQHYFFRNRSNTRDFYYQQRYNSFDANDAPTVLEELEAAHGGREYLAELLNDLQLTNRANSPLLHLSSGEHKRFQIIKALLQPRELLVLDEPYVGLDANSRQRLTEILTEIAGNGTQLILICDEEEIPPCINRRIHLKKGRIQTEVEAGAVRPTPESPLLPRSLSLRPAQTFSTAVKMRNVTVTYGQTDILSGIDWEIKKGEKWQLKGPNGAGKSTLLSLITGDHPQAYANEIYLFDRKRGTGESIWDIKKKIGYVSPELHWYFDNSITVFQAIASGFFDTIGLYKQPTVQQRHLIEQWLDLLQFSHVQNKPVSTISSSEQRLTLLLRALVKDPPLLLLDEPCQGLDERQTARFVDLVDTICEQLDKTLIYVSHYQHEIPGCVGHVLELSGAHAHTYAIAGDTAMAV